VINNFKVKSIFNSRDTNPSLSFYVKDNKILFNDFSAGLKGDMIKFYITYKKFFNNEDINYGQAKCNIIEDYKKYLKNNAPVSNHKVQVNRYEIIEYKVKKFSDVHVDYWKQFNITPALLMRYNIHPLDYILFSNDENSYRIRKPMMYGYFKKDGSIYKTYQPFDQDKKFNIYKQYTQGWEQLTWNKGSVVICSSMKDGLSLTSLGYSADFVAPNSETVMLREDQMNKLIKLYSKVFILYDNDATGNKNADKYVAKYDIRKIELPLSKDISDSVKDYGVDAVKKILNKYL